MTYVPLQRGRATGAVANVLLAGRVGSRVSASRRPTPPACPSPIERSTKASVCLRPCRLGPQYPVIPSPTSLCALLCQGYSTFGCGAGGGGAEDQRRGGASGQTGTSWAQDVREGEGEGGRGVGEWQRDVRGRGRHQGGP